MSDWGDKLSTSLRERLSSVLMATVLAVLIVLGVLAVLIVTVRGAQTSFATAAMTQSVAEVTEEAIGVIIALQEERAQATMLDHPVFEGAELRFEKEAIPATDEAIQQLRVAWFTQREQMPETDPPISDLLREEVKLEDFRTAAKTPTGESTFPLYNETVALAISATGELVSEGNDLAVVDDRTRIGALLGVAENLNTQRYLVQEALVSGAPMSEELLLQLDGLAQDTSSRLFEARLRAEGTDFERIEAIRTGDVAEPVLEVLASIKNTGAASPDLTPERWLEISSAHIELVYELLPVIHDRIEAEAAADLERAERSLWVRSILLGALFVVTILVASNAVFATRERGQALAEYEQLTDGLRQWFVAAAFPDLDGVRIAARYIPASVRTRSGGDWYDVYEVGDSLAVVIGDVAGHGADATAQMAQLRNILRGQSTARTLEPAAQIDLLNETISDSGILATLTYGLLDVVSGDFVYTRAGHMPLLIRSATGEVRLEEEAPGPPVGGGVDLRRDTTVTRLHPGDTLILITDGLVEGLNRDIDIALDQIAKGLTEAGHSPEEMLDQLFEDEEPIDDAAALLITWKPDPLLT